MSRKHHQRENQTFDIRENLDHGIHIPSKENQILFQNVKNEEE